MLEEEKIFLKDILDFEGIRNKFPDRRIKLRFNKYKEYDDITYNFVEWYKENKEGKRFNDSLLTVWSNKQKRIQDNDIIFQFIEILPHKWLFVNVHKIISTEENIAKAETLTEFEKYFGRLVVDFKNLGQNWYYIDENIINNIQVYEIKKKPYLDCVDEFRGFEYVSKQYKDLKQIIDSDVWRSALSSVYGVYVITDMHTGKLYIGSAYGENGIYGRWKVYLKDGYDKDEVENGNYPNKQLCNLVKSNGISYIEDNFQYSILEIFPKTIDTNKVLEREAYWKKVFKSKEYGYNDN